MLKELENMLRNKIEETKAEANEIRKEALFQDVMKLAWELSSSFTKLHPEIKTHPREYTYRELCGFKLTLGAIDKSSIVGQRYSLPLFKKGQTWT